jgi:hypothetical protein
MPNSARASASASARVSPTGPDGQPFSELTTDVSGRSRTTPPDSYSENTTDMAGRNQSDEQPYVPAPALPSMHSRPPLVDGFPPAPGSADSIPQQSGFSPDRPRLGGVYPGAAGPSGPGAAAPGSGGPRSGGPSSGGPSSGGPGSGGPGLAGPGPGIPGPGGFSPNNGLGPNDGPGPYDGSSGYDGGYDGYGQNGPGGFGPQSRSTVTPPGPDETASWPGPAEGDQGRFDQFKPDAAEPAPKPEPPRVRMLAVVLGVVLAAALVIGVALGIVWLIARGSDNGFSASAGDCVARSGDEAVKANCGDAGSFTVVSVVDNKDKCPDANQPYVLNPGKDGKVLCLKPSS